MSAADSDTEVSAVEEVQSGFWKAHQRREHITALELRAVRLAVLSFSDGNHDRYVAPRSTTAQLEISLLALMGLPRRRSPFASIGCVA